MNRLLLHSNGQNGLSEPSRPDISIVIPVFDEAENLPELNARLLASLAGTARSWEIIYIDDGSRDASASILRQLHQDDARIKAISLLRNFGHQPAITAGFHLAAGRCVIVLDADLQDPPEVIPELLKQWDAGYQVVVAERRSRAERGVRGAGLVLFYPLFHRLVHLPGPDAGVFALMDRVVVEQFNKLPERNRFIPGLRSWLGFKQTSVAYDRQPRRAGRSKQPLAHLVKYAMDAMIGFSRKPLRWILYAGLLITAITFALLIWHLIAVMLHHSAASPMPLCMLFLGGVQLISIGILGEYIGRIYEEIQHRPLYIVSDMLGFESDHPTPANGEADSVGVPPLST